MSRGMIKMRFRCPFGEAIVVAYQARLGVTADAWKRQKETLMALYQPSTARVLPVDHDEFFVPARNDAAAVLKTRKSFNYHMVEIVAARGTRNWSQPFSWVNVPYYYKVACTDLKDGFALDGSESTTHLARTSHTGPFPEFEHLRVCRNISACLFNHNVMWHVAIPSEDYFVNAKLWDQTIPHPGRPNTHWMSPDFKKEKRNKFKRCVDTPAAHGFPVFEDSLIWKYFQPT